MSTGNDNFITIDSISEIQDIVDGDYLFSISNGVIYKLDFQNFIIGLQNTDFTTLIDTLSAQVVTNTQSLCSINAYINNTVKADFDKLYSVYSTLNELSALWDSTYTTIHQLSSRAFLPTNEDILPGSLLYYNGDFADFITLAPGVPGEVVKINEDGIPIFGPSAAEGSTILMDQGNEVILQRNHVQRGPTSTAVNAVKKIVASQSFAIVTIQANTIARYGGLIKGPGLRAGITPPPSSIPTEVFINDKAVPLAKGIATIRDVVAGDLISIYANGNHNKLNPPGGNVVVTMNFKVRGTVGRNVDVDTIT